MQLPLLVSSFTTVFLAELGDKTQLAIVTISGTSARPMAVFAGSSVALVLASLLGAAAGGSLSAVVPTDGLQLAASVGFLVIGLRLILRADRDGDGSDGSGSDDSGSDGSGGGGKRGEDAGGPGDQPTA